MNKNHLFLIALCLSTLVNAELFKISHSGVRLHDNSQIWPCIVDVQSKLMWEVKTNTEGLQSSQNTYTWFDGESGIENGEYSRNCNWGQGCNTQSFIMALNTTNLCQSSDWRLPSESELRSLLVYNDNNPLVDTRYFPNTRSSLYWTSTTSRQNTDIAIDVPFFYGGTRGSGKSFDSHVRGVSSLP